MAKTASRHSILTYINGAKHEIIGADPEWTLAYYLRDKLHLTGTKISCEEGQCGSCTVVVAHLDAHGKPKYEAVNSCLFPIFLAHGCAITTVEGVGQVEKGMHPVQKRLAAGHGSQCGFCTPGFVMSMYALLRNHPEPTTKQIDGALYGNLCRCTGYRPILESFYTFTKGACGLGDKCCKNKQNAQAAGPELLTDWHDILQATKYDPTQDVIFPPELSVSSHQLRAEQLELKGTRCLVFVPTTIEQLLAIYKEHPQALLIGNGIMSANIERQVANPNHHWVSTARIVELRHQQINDQAVYVGASSSLDELQAALSEAEAKFGVSDSQAIAALRHNIEVLFSQQVRNQSTWAGNIAANFGVSTSCLTGVLLASAAELELLHLTTGARRLVSVDGNDFFPFRRNKNIDKMEIIVGLKIARGNKNEFVRAYKQGLRSGECERGIVNCAFRVQFDDAGLVADARFAFGGLTLAPILTGKSAAAMKGKEWTHENVMEACKIMADEVKLSEQSPGDKPVYRAVAALSLFHRYAAELSDYYAKRFNKGEPCKDLIWNHEDNHELEPLQLYSETGDTAGRPLMCQYGDRHTTGEAAYTGDIDLGRTSYFMALLLSPVAHAKIKSINASAATSLPGVLGWVDATDVRSGGTNRPPGMAGSPDDTPCFADHGEVTSQGQAIGGIVAETAQLARQAVKLVRVEYEVQPPVVGMQQALAKENFLSPPIVCKRGDNVQQAIEASECHIEGEIQLGGQEHVYMETQTVAVLPGEADEITIYSSTQGPSIMQEYVRCLTNRPMHKITVIVKRIGGGFGGKVTDSTTIVGAAVIAADKFRKPVTLVLNRHEDIIGTGKRHPVWGKFKAGFTKEGRVTAVSIDCYVDAGHRMGSSLMLAFVVANNADCAYDVPIGEVTCRALRTNTPSNTAFRGFGNPQSNYLIDNVLQHIALHLKMPPHKVREINMSKEGYQRLAGDIIQNDNMIRCFEECRKAADFEKRLADVAKFNQENKYRKQGIAFMPTRYPLGHGGFFEQGTALVNIYSDGSVMVSIGGVEIGQGLNIKCLQVAAQELGIPIERITILNNDTTRTPNAMPTGGSQGSDVHGLAVLNACQELKRRLEPMRAANPEAGWDEIVLKAYMSQVSLSCAGFGVPDRDGLKEKHGNRYTVGGAAVSVVELDTTTGAFQILHTTLVQDVGNSLNPAVDIGQIEGGFTQGFGWMTMEEIGFTKDGLLLQDSAYKYKIPTVATVPKQFNVLLLKKPGEYPGSVYSSKGIGEPPFYLGVSVYYALLDAINAARKDNALEPVIIQPPLTVDKCRLAIGDNIIDMIKKANQNGH